MVASIGSSGFDAVEIVKNLMLREKLQLNRLEKSAGEQQVKLSMFGKLQSLIEGFDKKLTAVSDAFETIGFKATSSDTDLMTATITTNDSVSSGGHTINVTQLAEAESLRSSTTFSERSTALGLSGDLIFTIGSNSFTVSVTTTNTLDDIRAMINDASDNVGVTANIIASTNGGVDEFVLDVTSNTSGVDNAVSISGGLETSFNFSQRVAAQNAEFTFDGLSVVRAENIVADVIDGITFTLLATGSTELTVSEDNTNKKAAVKTAIQEMVASFNSVFSAIDSSIADGSLRGSMMNMVKMQFGDAIKETLSGVGEFTSIFDFGIKSSKSITMQSDTDVQYTSVGQIEIDESKLDEMLESNLDDLESFFTTASTGLVATASTTIGTLVDYTGLIQTHTRSISEEISRLNREISKEEGRLNIVEEQLLKRYIDVQEMIGKFDNMSNYLTQQFANISFNRNK